MKGGAAQKPGPHSKMTKLRNGLILFMVMALLFCPVAGAAEAGDLDAGIGVIRQEYTGDDIAEILMITYDGSLESLEEFGGKDPEIELINNDIRAWPLRIYQEYEEGRLEAEANSIEIRSYAFEDDDYVQIITSCMVFPETRPDLYSKMWSWCYSKAEGRWVMLDDMMMESGLSFEGIEEAFAELYAPEFEGVSVESVETVGFLIDTASGEPVPRFILSAMVWTESDPWAEFFLYTPGEGSLEEIYTTGVSFSPDEYDMAVLDDPMLYMEEMPMESEPDISLSINTEGMENIGPGEYLLDGIVYFRTEDFPILAADGYDSDSMAARIMELEGENLTIYTSDENEEMSNLLTYPCWMISYDWGSNEDASHCLDFYFQTDTSEHRVHSSVPMDYATEYHDAIWERLSSMTLE